MNDNISRVFVNKISVKLFLASNYKQLSADIKCKNIRLKPVFISPDILKARAKKIGLNLMIVHFYIRRKQYIIRC